MTRPQPQQDLSCPDCSRHILPAAYGQETTCICGAHLILLMAGPTPRWTHLPDGHTSQTTPVEPITPQDHTKLTDEDAWAWFEAVEGRSIEEP